MRTLIVAALAAVGLMSTQVLAEDRKLDPGFTLEDFDLRSAQDLLDVCTLPVGHPEYDAAHGFCLGFMSGGWHFHNALILAEDPEPIVCPSEDVTREQAAQVFVAYGQANPQFLWENPMEVVFRALVEKWPCDA